MYKLDYEVRNIVLDKRKLYYRFIYFTFLYTYLYTYKYYKMNTILQWIAKTLNNSPLSKIAAIVLQTKCNICNF